MTDKLRYRLILHAGSRSELPASLLPYGIGPQSIASVLGGVHTQADHDKWFRQRLSEERSSIYPGGGIQEEHKQEPARFSANLGYFCETKL